MEPVTTAITAFINVIKEQDYVFANVSKQDIEQLQKQLREVRQEPSETIFKVIRKWYFKYPDVRDAVVKAEFDVARAKIKPTTTKPESQEGTKENQTRILEEELEKLKRKSR